MHASKTEKMSVRIDHGDQQGEGAFKMKHVLATGCSIALALILIDTCQVVKGPSGLTIVKGGQAVAAELPLPPPAAPVGKGKAPIGKGKGKAPAPPVVTKG
jgi:hypothetical protein